MGNRKDFTLGVRCIVSASSLSNCHKSAAFFKYLPYSFIVLSKDRGAQATFLASCRPGNSMPYPVILFEKSTSHADASLLLIDALAFTKSAKHGLPYGPLFQYLASY